MSQESPKAHRPPVSAGNPLHPDRHGRIGVPPPPGEPSSRNIRRRDPPASAALPGAPAADLWQTLARRRSLRQYQDRYLTQEELAALVWATQGVTLSTQNYLLRTAPSAGALYPVETYVAVQKVEDMEPGLWHLHLPDFSLELLKEMDTRQLLVQACLGQRFMGEAAVNFIWTGILNRSLWKYRERAIRYLFSGRRPYLPKPDAGRHCPEFGVLPGGGLL
jgi:hypothetical protein